MNAEQTVLTRDEVLKTKEEVVRRYGEWTDHNIHLVDDLYTIDKERASNKLCRYLQMVADAAREPIANLRVLDLACLEGLYAVEFARHGAEVVGIEGREPNIAKCRFAKEVLGLDNLSFYQDDVRNLSRDKYGEFDVVLCSGILYHLDAPDVLDFVYRMSDVCRGFTIIDTYVSLADKESFPFKGKTYWGRSVAEHAAGQSPDAKLGDLWASLDNLKSVWLTRASLLNLLTHAGFTSVYECSNPHIPDRSRDRITVLAMKGRRQRVFSLPPQAGDAAPPDAPEKPSAKVHPAQGEYYSLSKRLSGWVPRFIKSPLKKLLRGVGLVRDDFGGPWQWSQPWKRRDRKDRQG